MASSRRSLLAAFLAYPAVLAGAWHIAFAVGPGQHPEGAALYALATSFFLFVLLLATLQHTLVLSWAGRRISPTVHRWLPGLAAVAALASGLLPGIEWLRPVTLVVPLVVSGAVYGVTVRAYPVRRGRIHGPAEVALQLTNESIQDRATRNR